MKKIAISMAALTTATFACAQNSVTLFGVVDAAVTYTKGLGGGGTGKTQLTSNDDTFSRFGVRGTENLGGGLSVGFWLEAGFDVDSGVGLGSNTNNQPSGSKDDGPLSFNRRSTVSLIGSLGELRLGRDNVPTYWNSAVFDLVGGQGVAANQIFFSALGGARAPTGTRASNGISYFLPSNLGGFYGQAMVALGENDPNSVTSGTPALPNKSDGNYIGARIGYRDGPLNVAFSTGVTKYVTGDLRITNAGASYIFNSLSKLRISGSYYNESMGDLGGKGVIIGAALPVGVGEFRTSYAVYQRSPGGDVAKPTVSKISLKYVHSLSKRTAVYASIAHLRNRNGSAEALPGSTTLPNHAAMGTQIGLRHSF